jgi:HK97 gp10 family phage protein
MANDVAKETFKIEGLSDLKDALDEFPKATATAVVRRALLKAGEPIATAAESAAPVLRGKLQASIGTGTKLTRRQKKLHSKQSKVEIFVGAGGLPQAHLQEFGSIHGRPQPFMRPAWDANKHAALNSFKDDLAAEIKKTADRRARKAARDLAKIKR